MQTVEEAISQQQIHYIDYDQLLAACIIATTHESTAVLWQKGPLMWIHLSLSPKKVLMPSYEAVSVLIQNCKIESQKYFGKEPDEIFIPYSEQQLNWLLQDSDIWPIVCANFSGKINNHYPKDKLLQFASIYVFVFPINLCMQPIGMRLLYLRRAHVMGRQHM